jgi:hypothetical protein
MTTSYDFESPVHLQAVAAENLPPVTPALEDLWSPRPRDPVSGSGPLVRAVLVWPL